MLVYPPTPLGTQPRPLRLAYGSLMVPLWLGYASLMVPLTNAKDHLQNLEKHSKLHVKMDLGALSPARDALRSHQTL